MPDWTTPALPTDNIVKKDFWRTHVRDNFTAQNDIIGHPNGGHRSLTDGGVLLGNGTGAIQAMAVLAKGSLLAGDGVTDPQEFTVGPDGTLLRPEPTETLGLKWELPNWDLAEYLLYG